MCGIAGGLNRDGRPVDPRDLRAMIGALAHRGPDDEGVWTGDGVGLANRRLAVIDLSARGHQPMSNEDGSIWIALNGEIYNFESLREDLISRGHQFRSDSDTEVIVHLYEQYGAQCVARLRGMFALAIWDRPRRRLLLARDPLGKKPLFYVDDGVTIRFGSEPAAIVADPAFPRTADSEALHFYLAYGYVPHPLGAFAGMRKLPPAHTMVIEPGHKPVLARYWRPCFEPKAKGSEQELAHELRRHLDESVRLRLIADVPVGALLSGGIDSTAVVASVRRVSGRSIKTFSVGFDDAAYDELPLARQVAERYETDHHEVRVSGDVAELLPRLARAYGEPFADSSAVPSFLICEIARRSVTVALTGDGGDEAFGGYDRYRGLAASTLFDRGPAWITAVVARASRLIPVRRTKRAASRARRFFEAAALPAPHRYARWLTQVDSDLRRQLYTPAFAQHMRDEALLLPFERAFSESGAVEPIDLATAADLESYLPGDLLVKMDIASMANSLEARSPLLDRELFAFGASLPARFKARNGEGKWLFRRAIVQDLPPALRDRPKMGFAVPLEQWFRGPLRQVARDILLDRTARERGLFEPVAVRRMIEAHESGRALHHAQLWTLLMLELWFRTWIDAGTRMTPVRPFSQSEPKAGAAGREGGTMAAR